MAALWYHYFLPLLVNSAVLDTHFFYSNAVFGWDSSLPIAPAVNIIPSLLLAAHASLGGHIAT